MVVRLSWMRISCLFAVLSVLAPSAVSQAGLTVGLYFVEGQDEPIDFLTVPPFDPAQFIQPWQMTGPETEFVADGAFEGATEEEVRRAVLAEVRSKFYSLPTPEGTMLDLDFLPEKVSGPGTLNVLLGKHNIEFHQWFGMAASIGGGLADANGENSAAVSIDRIDSMLAVNFIAVDDALNAVANVTAHEVGHLLGLDHVWADAGAFGWEPGEPVVAEPYDVMATAPSGLPDSGWIQNNIFTAVPGTQRDGHSSASLLIEGVGLRLIGDLDGDSDVDNADLGVAGGAFTGAAGSGKQYRDGDMDFDGDVDNADLGLLSGGFSDAVYPGAGNIGDRADIADLIYDPCTGNVKVDANEAGGGIVTTFQFENADGTFRPENYIGPEGIGWTVYEDVSGFVIGNSDALYFGFSGTHNFGNVFPTGMDLEELEAYLTTAVYTGELGSELQEIDLMLRSELPPLVWIGGEGDWATAENWDAGLPPDGTTDANVQTVGDLVHVTTPDTLVRSLTISEGTVDISGGAVLSVASVCEGLAVQANGSLDVSGELSALFVSSEGTLTVQPGAVVTVDNLAVAGGSASIGEAISFGTLDVTGGAVVNVLVNQSAPVLRVSGAQVDVGSGAALTVDATGIDAGEGTINLATDAALVVGQYGGAIGTLGFAGTEGTPSTVHVGGPLAVATLTDGGAPGVFRKEGDATLTVETVTAQAGTAFQISGGTLAVGGAKPLGDSTQPIELDGARLEITAATGVPAYVDPVTAGMKARFDAGAITGVADGADITTWVDSAPGAVGTYDATTIQGTPNWVASEPELGGNPVVHFDDTGNESLEFQDISDIRTVFWVARQSGSGDLNFMLGDDNSYHFHAGNNRIMHSGNTSANIRNGVTRIDGEEVDGTQTTLPTDYSVLSIVATGNVQASRIARDRNIDARSWRGDIADIVIYNTALSDAEVAQMTQHLQNRYAMAGPLAIDMSGTPVHVTSDSELAIVGPSASLGALTLKGGILTTSGGPISFAATGIDLAATRVGVNPLSPTDYGSPITGGHAGLAFVLAGPDTKTVVAEADHALGTISFAAGSLAGATIEAAEGRTELVGPAAWAGSTEAVLSGGTLAVTPNVEFAPGAGPAGAVGVWKFDEGTGNTAVNSANPGTNDGTLIGMDESNWAEGKVGGALIFDGTAGYVNISQDDRLPIYNNGIDNAFTVAMWVKGGPQNDRRVFSEGSTTNDTPLFNMGTNNSTSTGQYAAYIRPTSGPTINHPLSTAEPFDDTWHHIAWVDVNGAATLYVDGVADAADFTYTRGTMALNTTTIGAILRGTPSYHFAGMIDEVYAYDRALTAEEVAAMAGVYIAESMSAHNVTVTVPSVLEAANAPRLDLGTLTLADGVVLETVGAPIRFTGATIDGAAVGITANTDTTLTAVTGLDAGAHDAMIAVSGSGRVILDKPAVGLDAGDTFRVQGGGTLGLLLQDAGEPAGAAALQFVGGGVYLSSAAGDADPAHREWDVPMSIGGSGKITAGPLPGGVETATMTVGGTYAVNLGDVATLSLEAQGGYTLDIAGDIAGEGGIKGTGGTVNVNSTVATYTGGTAVSSGEMNLNTPALNTSHVEVTGGVLNLNADVTTNGGLASGSVDYAFYDGATNADLSAIDNGTDNDATNGGLFALTPTESYKSTENMNRPYTNKSDTYGDMWSGVFIAPESGEYTFYVHGDDQEVLFIDLDQDGDFEFSNDEDITNNITDGWNTPKTGTATLLAGQAYGFALGHTEGSGGDWVEFQMQLPSESVLSWVDFGDGKWGTGTQSQTRVNAGVLNVGDGVTLTTEAVSVSGGGTLDVKPTGTLVTSMLTMDSGSVTVPHGLGLTHLNYSGGTLNLGGNLAVSERLTVGGPLDMTGKTLTTTPGVTAVDVLAGGTLTVDAPLVGGGLTVAGSLATPGFTFDAVTVRGVLDSSADATSSTLELTAGSQLNTNGNRITVSDSVTAGGITATATSGTFAVINPAPSSKIDTIDLNGAVVTIDGGGGAPSDAAAIWHLDEDAGATTALDSGPSAYDGTITGAIAGEPGVVGTAYRFDGGDIVNFGTGVAEMQAPGAFSVAMWFSRHTNNTTDATNHNVNNVLIAQSGDSGNDNLEIGTQSDIFEVYVDAGGTDDSTHAVPGGIDNDRWYHVVLTYDQNQSNEMKFYLNGELLAETGQHNGALAARSSNSALTLGGARPDRTDPWGDFDGWIDEVYLFSRALVPEEAAALANPSGGAVLNNVTGNGTLVGEVVIDGTVSPGPAGTVGTIVVEGSLTMGDESVYEWEIGLGEGTYDSIAVTGDLTLSDTWTLALGDLGGSAGAADEFDLFTYTGVYTGQELFEASVIDGSAVDPETWNYDAAQIEHDPVGRRVYLTGLIIATADGTLKWAAGADGAWGAGAPDDWVLVGDWNGPEPVPDLPDDSLVAAVVDTPHTVSVQDADRQAYSLAVSGGGKVAVAAGRALQLLTGATVAADGELEIGGAFSSNGFTTAGTVTVKPGGGMDVGRLEITGGAMTLSEDISARNVKITGGALNTGDKAVTLTGALQASGVVVTSDAASFQAIGSGQAGQITVGITEDFSTTTVTAAGGSGGTLNAPDVSFRSAAVEASLQLNADAAVLGDVSFADLGEILLPSDVDVSVRNLTGPGGVVGDVTVRGAVRPGSEPDWLDVFGTLTLMPGAAFQPEVQGPDALGLLYVDDVLDLTAADDMLAISWTPTDDPNSEFGGPYVVAEVFEVLGEFDVLGGGNIGKAYIADVVYWDLGDAFEIEVTLYEPIEGDVNLDGVVDGEDVNAMSPYVQKEHTSRLEGDLNYDGRTDHFDYLLVKLNMGNSLSDQIPEPATLLLLALGACPVLLGRKRRM